MEFAYLQGVSLIDYPDKVAAVVWTIGCNLRCPFCYNAELVLPELARLPRLSEEKVLGRLRERTGFLDGLVVTGGEPTLHPDLPGFLREVKALGFRVKLDTNGTRPDVLARLLREGLLDYVALDVKAPFALYPEFTGLPPHPDPLPPGGDGGIGIRTCQPHPDPLPPGGEGRLGQEVPLPPGGTVTSEPAGGGQRGVAFAGPVVPPPSPSREGEKGRGNYPAVVRAVQETLALIMEEAPDYEFRTTVAPSLTGDDLMVIAHEIRGARRYVLQPFFAPEEKALVDESWRGRPSLAVRDLCLIAAELAQWVPTEVRG
ncbi:MAG: anaerobic ribonucleoside-triphosphate reductase activating protein [Candidatus Bipolaricaulota bacterium]